MTRPLKAIVIPYFFKYSFVIESFVDFDIYEQVLIFISYFVILVVYYKLSIAIMSKEQSGK